MSQMFARVELRGVPGDEIYDRLHAHMASLNWYQWIVGTDTIALPHATYQAQSLSENPNLMALAVNLKTNIEAKIWPKALVLVIRSAKWAQTSG